jgi:hypothetical protein
MYRRALEYLPSLTEPVFTDGVSVYVDGLITPRIDVTVSGGYVSGASALSPALSAFKTSTGDVRIRYAINRTLAGYVQYLYYFYDFSGQARLAPRIASRFERNAIRAGFTLWLPVMQR